MLFEVKKKSVMMMGSWVWRRGGEWDETQTESLDLIDHLLNLNVLMTGIIFIAQVVLLLKKKKKICSNQTKRLKKLQEKKKKMNGIYHFRFRFQLCLMFASLIMLS